MGGTEIYQPIEAILKEPADATLPRHLYLLTDGEVSNTQVIVDLIEKNREKCHVHTFGIGSGASTELVRNCAIAGNGHFSFILKIEEIEQKVVGALYKDYFDYLIVKEATILDASGNVV